MSKAPWTWKGDGEATNKNALVCYVSKRREPRGRKYGKCRGY